MPRRLYLIPQKSLISGCGLNSFHQLSHLIVYNRNARLENRPSADPKQRGSVHKARNSYAEFQNPLYLRRAPNHSLAQILAMPSQNQKFQKTPALSQCRFQTKKKPHQANLVLNRPNPICKAPNAVARSYFLIRLGFFTRSLSESPCFVLRPPFQQKTRLPGSAQKETQFARPSPADLVFCQLLQ